MVLRLALFASLLVAGCTGRNPDARLDLATAPNDMATAPRDLVPPPPPQDLAPTGVQLTAGGLLESVAPDQSLVAFLPAPSTVTRVSTGELDVQAVPYGQPRRIADNAWGAGFSGGNVLYYSTAPAASTDAGSTAIYGGLGVWRKGWSAGLS